MTMTSSPVGPMVTAVPLETPGRAEVRPVWSEGHRETALWPEDKWEWLRKCLLADGRYIADSEIKLPDVTAPQMMTSTNEYILT